MTFKQLYFPSIHKMQYINVVILSALCINFRSVISSLLHVNAAMFLSENLTDYSHNKELNFMTQHIYGYILQGRLCTVTVYIDTLFMPL